MEKTAVEFIFDAVYRDITFSELLGIIAQAKVMEKQQDKKMYSEEDIRESFRQGHKSSQAMGSYNSITEQEDFDKWFEQFKKK